MASLMVCVWVGARACARMDGLAGGRVAARAGVGCDVKRSAFVASADPSSSWEFNSVLGKGTERVQRELRSLPARS